MADIVHVAIALPDILESSLVKEVAAILNEDLYGTHRLTAEKIPRIDIESLSDLMPFIIDWHEARLLKNPRIVGPSPVE